MVLFLHGGAGGTSGCPCREQLVSKDTTGLCAIGPYSQRIFVFGLHGFLICGGMSSQWNLVTLKGRFMLYGGIQKECYSSKDCRWYDPDSDDDMSVSMMEFTGVTAFNNQIFVLGGNDGGNSFYSNIESYDTTEDKWKVMASLTLPYGRCRFTAVAMGTQQT
ncbi:Hypothetical predicted protein [Mytilus galloprovincialis]|uniref:Uncharacterized protein n=1 Tax=Mytilus galloprovincialis TaxID=29158 RepID=A0A8B6F075_MYTGA|nr:Hypothetical predicted protein [Mytilus galloprovincialis]